MPRHSDEFKLRAVEMSISRPANSVARELGCAHTSIYSWAEQFGVTIMKMERKPWDEKEVDILRRYAGKTTVSKIARKLGRTVNSTVFKMHALGISTSVKSRHLSRDDLNFICDNWSRMPCKQISERLGWGYSAVYSAAKRMGLI